MEAKTHQFTSQDGLALATSYLDDPSHVECPQCGPNKIEVVAYVDSEALARKELKPAPPEDRYTVILWCHGCRRMAALDLSRAGAR